MNNATVRTISSVGFVIVMLAGLLIGKFAFAVLFLLIIAGMMSEFYRMTMGDSYLRMRRLAIATGLLFFILVYLYAGFGLDARYILLWFIPLFAIFISSLYLKDKTDYQKTSYLYSGLLYLALPFSLTNLIVFKNGDFSGLLLLSLFVIIWMSDAGAYTVGTLWGQKENSRKLFPSISPKKSWIGFWGGMAFAIIAAFILRSIGWLEIPVVHCAIFAIVVNVADVFGDLFESQWKRVCGLKDSGNVIPGHGGVLDRFDSSVFAITAACIYLYIFNLI